MYSYILLYKKMSYSHLLKLCEMHYNGKPHTSLDSFSPFEVNNNKIDHLIITKCYYIIYLYITLQAHWNSHISSHVVRFQDGQFTQQQRQALRVFGDAPDRRFAVGDLIWVKNKRHAFHKNDPINYPTFGNEPYIVKSICKKYLPWKYLVEKQNSEQQTQKQLYAFEMKKISSINDPSSIPPNPITTNASHILVNDVIRKQQPTLRSGKVLPNRENDYYRIVIDGKQEIVTPQSLKLMVKTFHRPSVRYGPFFDQKHNQHYKI